MTHRGLAVFDSVSFRFKKTLSGDYDLRSCCGVLRSLPEVSVSRIVTDLGDKIVLYQNLAGTQCAIGKRHITNL